MNSNVCAVIVTYNCDDNFLDTFNSVINQVDYVVVVDNGSQQNTLDMLNRLDEVNDIELILCGRNLGIAAALNKGVQYALEKDYQWVITLDHDSRLSDDMVETLLKAYDNLDADKKDRVVSLLPKYLELGFDMDKQISQRESAVKDIEFGITSGNLVNRKAFEQVGLFDEKLFIDYVDYDFCFRLKEKGFDIIEVSDAILFHRLGESKEKSFLGKKMTMTNHSPLRRYYMTRNRKYCWEKYGNVVPEAIKFDKSSAIKETIKIVLYEEQKLQKLKMIVRGKRDNKKGIFGEYRG